MQAIIHQLGLSLWRLLPGNPIVVRVVQGGSKRMQHLWIRAGYLLVLLFAVLIVQLGMEQSGSLANLAKASTRVFTWVSLIQLAMMCFLAPVFTAGAISQERDAETFNVLLTTPLTNAQIVLGSLMSRLFFVFMLLVAGLPIFCITMLFGGVTTDQIFLSFGIAGCTALLTGSLAIVVSVTRIGSRGSVFSFYMAIAFFITVGLLLGLWPATYVVESVNTTGQGMSWLAPFHPFLALAAALNMTPMPDAAAVAHYGWPVGPMLAYPYTAYMVLTFIVSTILIAFAALFVRSGAKQGEPTFWSKILPKRKRIGESGERLRKPRHVWANPVAWREAVTRAGAASSNLVRYSYLIGGTVSAVMLLVAYGNGWFRSTDEARAWLSGVVMVEFVSVLIMAANTSAAAISREREVGTMELLLTTPLTSRYIIWGKLRGLVSFTVPLLAVPAVTALMLAMYDFFRAAPDPIVPLTSALVLPPLLLVYSSFTCMIGLQTSLKCRKTVQAVLTAVGIILLVGFGLAMCAFAAVKGADQLGALMAPVTFVTAVYFVLNPTQFSAYTSGGQGDIIFCMLIGTVIAVAIYGAIVAGTYKSMVTNFDMIVRKQSR